MNEKQKINKTSSYYYYVNDTFFNFFKSTKVLNNFGFKI